VEYLINNIDALSTSGLGQDGSKIRDQKFPFIHIVDHTEVRISSCIFGHFEQRSVYAIAKFESLFVQNFRFGQEYDSETFNVALQSLFCPTPERDNLLSIVGNIKEEAVHQYEDDGVTQTVTARQGIGMAKQVQAPNPITLQPYRTFREIEQPESKFIFRMKSGQEGQKPTCALYEADGGSWKLTAIERIKAFIYQWLAEVKFENVSVIG